MKQRAGFARAFVKKPAVLFLDEPFSALDVLTAENLRGEISDLWEKGDFPARSVLMVTHNIEEAVLLADRVVIMGANPGHVRGEVMIDLPRPRDRNLPHFQELVDHIYVLMTNPEMKVQDVVSRAEKMVEPRFSPLSHARAGGISGLLELVEDQGGTTDLAKLAGDLRLSVNDLLVIVDAAVMLGFAQLAEGEISLTEVGAAFANADILTSKEIFRQQVLERIPLIQIIVQTLSARKSGAMRSAFFEDVLDEHFPEAEAEKQFRTAVDWGRYAELFEYDAAGGWLTTSR
jgi:NitT/TauT family transport system ATP-binding protein